ncbi:hypothetical protein ASH01_21140 [Terrabacter sp. Soil811]|uniref:hypothetical protein n=1 Tax=Terrabacter sp. Soil811 TaxID=1736419 RepID=UPI0006FF5207|nr:hypothetical protein [Terrabacter sp. Soil811]KRF47802.1 hypothetical protein ASH01_21140 [Terrabacter sp. Soil811]
MTQPALDLVAGMPAHFEMPMEFLELAEWAERVRYVRNGYGSLVDPGQDGRSLVEIGDPARVGWSGYLTGPDRLWFVLRTGGDGSSVCLWLDDQGQQQVVHHGSGSGSILFAVLPSALHVLRLLAVGYPEPCWNEDWASPPEDDDPGLAAYRSWCRERWDIIPAETGVVALGLQAVADQWTRTEGPQGDPFGQWLERPGTVVAR